MSVASTLIVVRKSDRLALHLFIGSVPGGVLRYVVDSSVATIQEGGRVLLAGQRGGWHSLVDQHALEWLELPIAGGPLDLWRSARTLARIIGEREIGIVHAHHRRATLVARLAGRWLSKDRRPPVLYTLHLTDMPMKFPWRWVSDFGDHCHAPSMAAKRWLMEVARVPEDRITVIPHGIRAQRWPATDAATRSAARAAMRIPADALVVSFVARLEAPKNEAWVVDLAEECRRRGIAARFLVAGDGPNRMSLEQHIARLGLHDWVTLLGERDPLQIYQASDLFVLPSSREGFSYACAEAMCCGVPVLRTRTAGTEEMIVEGVTGRSCAIDHGIFIATGVEMLLKADGLPSMGLAAAAHVREHLTFERQVRDTLALYERLSSTSR